ncbi:MAG: IPTL-CTERM sorting domain-containing protein [Betaproteobacteria bacterium]|nr:IPTL-CTERM sorting domain-containing protein [Betaproteobacteria bacterium]
MNRSPALTRAYIGLAVFLFAAANALAGVVSTTANSGVGSLRDTLAAAVSGETITFSLPLPATIALSSELPLTQSVTIQGPGANLLTISNATGRVFNLDTAGKDVVISGVHLTGQNPSGDGGAIINNGGNLTIVSSLIDNSTSPGEGGAIRNNFNPSTGYSLTIQNSTIAGNTANKSGAIYFIGFGLTIENSTIYNNHATDSSGAIGLFSGFGFIRNSTIAGNTANTVAGITSQDSQLTFESTIVANNTDITGINDLNRTGGGNGSFVNATNSLFTEKFPGGRQCPQWRNRVGNLIGVDPQLGALAANGGPTQTLRPGPASPAIGAGINLQGYAYDQRGSGFPRNADSAGAPGSVDIGAIQRYVLAPPVTIDIPTLQPWALLLLVMLVGLFAHRRRRSA